MNHRYRLFVLAALSAALVVTAVAGCASTPTTTPSSSSSKSVSGPSVVVTQKDAGSIVMGEVGKNILVQLPSNVTTGYTWKATALPPFMVQAGDPVYESQAASGVVGAGGTQTFTFTVKAQGRGDLTLGYARPSDKGKPAQTFTVTVDATY